MFGLGDWLGSAFKTTCRIHFSLFPFILHFTFYLYLFILSFHFIFSRSLFIFIFLLSLVICIFSFLSFHFHFLLVFRLNELAGQTTEGSALTSCRIHSTNSASIPQYSVQSIQNTLNYKKILSTVSI